MDSKSYLSILALMILSGLVTFTQKYLSNSHQVCSELKYLTENQAESYIEFGAKQMRGNVQIK